MDNLMLPISLQCMSETFLWSDEIKIELFGLNLNLKMAIHRRSPWSLKKISQEALGKLLKSNCEKLVKNYPRKLGGNCCQRCFYKVLNKGSEWLSKWEGLSICVILCKVNLIHFNLRYFCGCKCRINERSQWRMARLVWAHKEATISKKNTL